MLLIIGVYTYKVLLLTLLVGIPNTIARHQKQHKLADKNDMKNYFMAHKKEIRVICGSFITLRQRSKVGTPLGDHIDRVGQVFYEAA